jgi:hypothetical protein
MVHNRGKYTSFSVLFISMGLMLLICTAPLNAQYLRKFHMEAERGLKSKRVSLPFEMVHNLIILPVFINESDTLFFILDTGVGSNLLTSTENMGTLTFKHSRQITIYGLGGASELKAIHSFGNEMRFPGVVGDYQDVIIPEEDLFHLSQSLGRQVNGIMGFDVFNSFVVEIKYSQKRIILYEPDYFDRKIRKRRTRKGDVVPIVIKSRKPYVQVFLKDENGKKYGINLLIDSGASHALSLFPVSDERLSLPDKTIRSFLGLGLGGEIYGDIGRLDFMKLGRYEIHNLVSNYPDEDAIQMAIQSGDRHGSLGADLLKRFDVVFDYHNQEMILRPNKSLRKRFNYNMSGIELTTPVPGLPLFKVAKVRKGSPGWSAGINVGDQIVSINGHNVAKFELGQIIELLQSRPGKKIRIGVIRNEGWVQTHFTLEDPI